MGWRVACLFVPGKVPITQTGVGGVEREREWYTGGEPLRGTESDAANLGRQRCLSLVGLNGIMFASKLWGAALSFPPSSPRH